MSNLTFHNRRHAQGVFNDYEPKPLPWIDSVKMNNLHRSNTWKNPQQDQGSPPTPFKAQGVYDSPDSPIRPLRRDNHNDHHHHRANHENCLARGLGYALLWVLCLFLLVVACTAFYQYGIWFGIWNDWPAWGVSSWQWLDDAVQLVELHVDSMWALFECLVIDYWQWLAAFNNIWNDPLFLGWLDSVLWLVLAGLLIAATVFFLVVVLQTVGRALRPVWPCLARVYASWVLRDFVLVVATVVARILILVGAVLCGIWNNDWPIASVLCGCIFGWVIIDWQWLNNNALFRLAPRQRAEQMVRLVVDSVLSLFKLFDRMARLVVDYVLSLFEWFERMVRLAVNVLFEWFERMVRLAVDSLLWPLFKWFERMVRLAVDYLSWSLFKIGAFCQWLGARVSADESEHGSADQTARQQCQGTTKKQERCKNLVGNGRLYCHLHQGQLE